MSEQEITPGTLWKHVAHGSEPVELIFITNQYTAAEEEVVYRGIERGDELRSMPISSWCRLMRFQWERTTGYHNINGRLLV